MIILYTRKPRDSSDKKVEKWLKARNISYRVVSPRELNQQFVMKIFSLSENGIEELFVSRSRSWSKLGLTNKAFNQLQLSALIQIVIRNPNLLKSPIVFNDSRLVIGYNEEKLRVFVSSDYRKVQRSIYKEK